MSAVENAGAKIEVSRQRQLWAVPDDQAKLRSRMTLQRGKAAASPNFSFAKSNFGVSFAAFWIYSLEKPILHYSAKNLLRTSCAHLCSHKRTQLRFSELFKWPPINEERRSFLNAHSLYIRNILIDHCNHLR